VNKCLTNREEVGLHLVIILDSVDKSYAVKIKCFVAYRRQLTERIVEPYGLICKHHNWYLVGKCLEKQALCTFRIDQIETAIPYKERKFLYPTDFSLEEHCKNSWGGYS
jgi:proteasome accessory factor B